LLDSLLQEIRSYSSHPSINQYENTFHVKKQEDRQAI